MVAAKCLDRGCCGPAATGSRCGGTPNEWLAYWDMFDRPQTKPEIRLRRAGNLAFDAEKAKRIVKGLSVPT